jgi:hypothetical protein
VKDKYLGSAFFDASASAFIMPDLLSRLSHKKKEPDPKLVAADNDNATRNPGFPVSNRHQGAALGPEWLAKSKLLDDVPMAVKGSTGSLLIHYEQVIYDMKEGTGGSWITVGDTSSYLHAKDIQSMTAITTVASPNAYTEQDYPLHVRTSNDKIIACDFLISATGVYPCSDFVGPEFIRGQSLASVAPAAAPVHYSRSDRGHTGADGTHTQHITSRENEDGALIVNEMLQTSVKGVYAAGDCCLYQPATAVDQGMDTDVSPTSIGVSDINNALAGKHWFQMKLWTQARSTGIYAALWTARFLGRGLFFRNIRSCDKILRT